LYAIPSTPSEAAGETAPRKAKAAPDIHVEVRVGIEIVVVEEVVVFEDGCRFALRPV
jgi:hypothetical protein